METRTALLPIAQDSDFSIYNLPFGIFKTEKLSARCGLALGDYIIDTRALQETGLLGELGELAGDSLEKSSLNDLISKGPEVWRTLRLKIQDLFTKGNEGLWADVDFHRVLVRQADAEMLLPVQIGDYTDFYSSEYHASNVGAMFRDPQNPLLPNWKHVPVGYHGRSSSIVVSGTDFIRPRGQVKPPTAEVPGYQLSKQIDLELETGFIIGRNTIMGESIEVDEAEDFMFGMVLFNDWSARDIQSWEYVPLGPFLGKNFCSSMSPWIVTFDALEPFRIPMPSQQEPEVQPYLKQKDRWTYDITLEAHLGLSDGAEMCISKTNQKYLYWSMNQQLAHHTVNGCPMRVGDLCASGTISGPDKSSLGCLLEITKRGQEPVTFPDGRTRTFMEDGDHIILKGFAEKEGIRVGFGEVIGRVLPNRN